MPRKAVKMSESDFEALVISWAKSVCSYNTFKSDEEIKHGKAYGRMYVVDCYVHNGLMECVDLENKIFKDLSKVQFDWENCGCEPDNNDPCGFWTTSSGIPTLGCYAGGDWEDPVYFVLYPETATTIRAYMPKDGNTWNIKTKVAYGNNDDEGDPDDNPRKVDVAAFRADVERRLSL
jgi:hypothetical protein